MENELGGMEKGTNFVASKLGSRSDLEMGW